MVKNLQVLLTILQLQKVWNVEPRGRQLNKRSPLDVRPSFINLPQYLIPHHLAAAYRPTPHNQQHITSNHIQIIEKKPGTGDNLHFAHPGQATSNMHHTSIHTDIKHYLTNNNVKVPIVTQIITHTATNITHPSKMAPVLVHFHPNQFVQEYRSPFHDLSVIPLHRSRSRSEQKKLERDAAADSYEDDSYGARFRKFYGGFGPGLTFGGHGAGHGFYAYG